jgi:shikimate kinase
VIARLLDQPAHVLATGGGAFMHDQTRELIKSRAISVWLKADLDVLVRRVSRKDTRPLLAGKDPMAVLEELAASRYPIYGQADVIVETGDAAHHVTVDQVMQAITAFLGTPAQ